MKKLLLVIAFALISTIATSQTIIELGSVRSMCITGKGPGQDGAINPFIDKDSYVLVENLGKNVFEVRVQKNGKIIEQFEVKPKAKVTVSLLKGYELYFDSVLDTTAKVDFKEKIE